MNNLESQKYRNDLIKTVKQEPDKDRRIGILTEAQSTEEYQRAKSKKHSGFFKQSLFKKAFKNCLPFLNFCR